MLKVENVTKKYGKNKVLDGVNYQFKKGLYGIIGPNGAGKSTLLDIITTAIMPTGGEVRYNGVDIYRNKDYRKYIAYVPQQQKMFEEFTGRQYLGYFAALKGLKGKKVKGIIDKVLEDVNLTEAADKRIKSYSGGMKQRILIAQAFMTEFEILILDEPGASLDIIAKNDIIKYMKKYIAEGGTILIASHEEGELSVCNRKYLMQDGTLVETDPSLSITAIMERMVKNNA